MDTFVYTIIYIYIYCHPQTDCVVVLVVFQLISAARHPIYEFVNDFAKGAICGILCTLDSNQNHCQSNGYVYF